MSEERARSPALVFVKNGILLLCLLAPSIWMMANVPALWRDADAYFQLTKHPLIATYWGHAPAYSYLARVPLSLGGQVTQLRGLPIAEHEAGTQPLTDTGVWLLITTQHLAMCASAFCFVRTVAISFCVRLGLVLLWASNALFYTFAHCVGSETLGLICIILVVTAGMRLIRNRLPERRLWSILSLALCGSILARHVNLWLTLLLPATFLVSALTNWALSRFGPKERRRWWLGKLSANDLRRAVMAIGLGLVCLVVANSLPLLLARKTPFHPHSRIGFTFLWRLHFLKDLSPEARDALIERVAARTDSTQTRKLILLLGQMYDEGADLDGPGVLMERAFALLFPEPSNRRWDDLDLLLNQMAYSFLWPPTPEHLQFARKEFVSALTMPVTDISVFLFVTTVYYFEHKEGLPALANLATFRDSSIGQIMQIPTQHLYFQFWKGISYNKALVLWALSFLIFLIVTRKKATDRRIGAFAVILTIIGLIMMGSTCFVGQFIPRYALPMWGLLLLSFYVLIARLGDLLVRRGWSRVTLDKATANCN
jgi:hypothetical protein